MVGGGEEIKKDKRQGFWNEINRCKDYLKKLKYYVM